MQNNSYLFTILSVFCSLFFLSSQAAGANVETKTERNKIIIAAHGGGTGVLAGTLAALGMTAAEDIDFIEVEVTGTADNELIVSRTADLGQFTDVADIFPEKLDDTGRYPASSFNLLELRQLRKIDKPGSLTGMPIASFEEYLALIRYLETKLGKKIGLAVNLVEPSSLKSTGLDMSSRALGLLKAYGYGQPDKPLILQSLDSNELQRIKKELLPAYMMEIPLYQRLARRDQSHSRRTELASKDQSWMYTRIGVRMVGSYASGIIIDAEILHDEDGNLLDPTFTASLKENGLDLVVFNLPETDQQPLTFASDYRSLLGYYFDQLGADGIVTSEIRASISYFEPAEPSLPLLPLKSPFTN